MHPALDDRLATDGSKRSGQVSARATARTTKRLAHGSRSPGRDGAVAPREGSPAAGPLGRTRACAAP